MAAGRAAGGAGGRYFTPFRGIRASWGLLGAFAGLFSALLAGQCYGYDRPWRQTVEVTTAAVQPSSLTMVQGESVDYRVALRNGGAFYPIATNSLSLWVAVSSTNTTAMYVQQSGVIMSASNGVVAFRLPATNGVLPVGTYDSSVIVYTLAAGGTTATLATASRSTIQVERGDAAAGVATLLPVYLPDYGLTTMVTKVEADARYVRPTQFDGTSIVTNPNGTISAISAPSPDQHARDMATAESNRAVAAEGLLASNLLAHTTNAEPHVSTSDRSTWNGKTTLAEVGGQGYTRTNDAALLASTAASNVSLATLRGHVTTNFLVSGGLGAIAYTNTDTNVIVLSGAGVSMANGVYRKQSALVYETDNGAGFVYFDEMSSRYIVAWDGVSLYRNEVGWLGPYEPSEAMWGPAPSATWGPVARTNTVVNNGSLMIFSGPGPAGVVSNVGGSVYIGTNPPVTTNMLLLNGSRPMTGGLNMGGYPITNAMGLSQFWDITMRDLSAFTLSGSGAGVYGVDATKLDGLDSIAFLTNGGVTVNGVPLTNGASLTITGGGGGVTAPNTAALPLLWRGLSPATTNDYITPPLDGQLSGISVYNSTGTLQCFSVGVPVTIGATGTTACAATLPLGYEAVTGAVVWVRQEQATNSPSIVRITDAQQHGMAWTCHVAAVGTWTPVYIRGQSWWTNRPLDSLDFQWQVGGAATNVSNTRWWSMQVVGRWLK